MSSCSAPTRRSRNKKTLSLRNEHLLDLRFATSLILDSRTIGNKFYWFLSDLFHGIFFYQPNRLKDARVLERCVVGWKFSELFYGSSGPKPSS